MTRRSLFSQAAFLALLRGETDQATELITRHVKTGEVSAASLYLRHHSSISQRAFGGATSSNAVFLIASITKPMTATGLMLLVDRKELSLSDPVQRFLPEFRGGGRERVLLKNLLTHTSGLPDMLPEDQALRERHAPLREFVEGACRTPLLFMPGSQVRYQSMGFLLAAEIARRISGQPFPGFLRDHIFQPLGMSRTSLGLGSRTLSQTMFCQVAHPSDWDWNSAYWRNLAAPWGGALATASDVARLLEYFAHPDHRVLQPGTASSMTTDQTPGLNKRWGIGWMLNNGQFGNNCSASVFGHSGSTGTMCWHDPAKELTFVLLTTKPAVQSDHLLLTPVSEIVAREG